MHSIYANFLNALDLRDVRKAVISETYVNIHILLNSQKISGSSSYNERTLLKNLGAWLGLQTIVRNKPILYKDLPLKQLLLATVDATHKNHIYLVPFICKLLLSCKDSFAFRLPSPWLMSILSVLKEMHHAQKLTLRFEIELLYKNLNIAFDDIPNTSCFKNAQQEQHLIQQQNLQLLHQQQLLQQRNVPRQSVVVAPRSPISAIVPVPSTPHIQANTVSPLSQVNTAPMSQFRAPHFPLLTRQPNSMQPYIVIPTVPLFQQQPHFEIHVLMALEHVVQELTATGTLTHLSQVL